MDKTTFNKKLGEFVKLRRQQKKLSQANLSDKMGLDYQYISRVERGLVSPTVFWLSRLCDALDIDFTLFMKDMGHYLSSNQDAQDS